ncbi:hypothetical protein DWW20_19865 [Ruminococcus sp. AF14-5]|nr:hypothetical protein DWW20_19865 [Ruminococcus sp. AF14-5]
MTADVNELSGAIAKILVILSLFILVFTLLTCFANVVLFGKIFGKKSKKKWLSFVPFVNDYIIYDTFWNTKMFALYIVVNFVMQVVTRFASEKSASISVLYMVATLIVLFLDIAIMTHIATSFGKTGFSNVLWSIGLFALYPLFIVILAKRNEFTPEVAENIKKKAEEREKRKAERAAEKEARKKREEREKKEAGL